MTTGMYCVGKSEGPYEWRNRHFGDLINYV